MGASPCLGLPLGLALAMALVACDTAKQPSHGVDFSDKSAVSAVGNKQEVRFQSGKLTLAGVVYLPRGKGPFPAVLWNHGSYHDPMVAFDLLAPVFAERGWLLFGPFRRGQGLSQAAGPYIRDEIERAGPGLAARVARTTSLLTTEHLDDQLAAYAWLKQQPYVQPDRIAVAGNSFGGIEVVLGAARLPYCAAVNAAGASQTWAKAPPLQQVMLDAARSSQAPMLLLQAENDYDLTPTRAVAEAMQRAGKSALVKFYPPFGESAAEGHNFAWRGSRVWGSDVFAFLNTHCT